MRGDREAKNGMRFEAVQKANVPTGRNGKHKHIVLALLSDIEKLADGEAKSRLKVRSFVRLIS